MDCSSASFSCEEYNSLERGRSRKKCDKEGERKVRANIYVLHKAEMYSAVLLKPAIQSDTGVYLLQERLGI